MQRGFGIMNQTLRITTGVWSVCPVWNSRVRFFCLTQCIIMPLFKNKKKTLSTVRKWKLIDLNYPLKFCLLKKRITFLYCGLLTFWPALSTRRENSKVVFWTSRQKVDIVFECKLKQEKKSTIISSYGIPLINSMNYNKWDKNGILTGTIYKKLMKLLPSFSNTCLRSFYLHSL